MAPLLQGTTSEEVGDEAEPGGIAEEEQAEGLEPAGGRRTRSGGALGSMVQVLEVLQAVEQQMQPVLRSKGWSKGDSDGGQQAAALGSKRAAAPARRRKWRMCWLCWGCVG
jgi:hypothetical protein